MDAALQPPALDLPQPAGLGETASQGRTEEIHTELIAVNSLE